MKMNQAWNKVAGLFDTYKEDIWYGAADNIETAWPVVLDYVKKQFTAPSGLKALDFGCGTGMFCRKLNDLGFITTGIDLSEEMIKIGKKNLNGQIKLFVGDTDTAKSLAEENGSFDLVTSVMVLQFIENDKIADLAQAVGNKGHFVFVNHNPKHLEARGTGDTFTLSGTETTVPIYKRTPEDYDAIFLKLGFSRTLEQYVSESKEFLAKYKIERKTEHPKYMILGYKR